MDLSFFNSAIWNVRDEFSQNVSLFVMNYRAICERKILSDYETQTSKYRSYFPLHTAIVSTFRFCQFFFFLSERNSNRFVNEARPGERLIHACIRKPAYRYLYTISISIHVNMIGQSFGRLDEPKRGSVCWKRFFLIHKPSALLA